MAIQRIVILSEVWRGSLRQTKSKNLLLELLVPYQGLSETLHQRWIAVSPLPPCRATVRAA
jgi:hypothetical protein